MRACVATCRDKGLKPQIVFRKTGRHVPPPDLLEHVIYVPSMDVGVVSCLLLPCLAFSCRVLPSLVVSCLLLSYVARP